MEKNAPSRGFCKGQKDDFVVIKLLIKFVVFNFGKY